MTTQQALLPHRPDSVLLGKDAQAIEVLIDLHGPEEPHILDATYNSGKMWKGCSYRPDHTLDIDPAMQVDSVADNRAMAFPAESFSVVVYDPPHLPVAMASKGASEHPNVVRFRGNYGASADPDQGRNGDDVSEQFAPFLAEAERVLVADGIVLAKIADLVHNHRYQWQFVAFVNAVDLVPGLTPCDLLIKRDPSAGNLKSSKWKQVHHLRKAHCYWIVVRKGRCEKRGDRR